MSPVTQRSAAESAWTEERASLVLELESANTKLEDVKADKAGTEARLQGELSSLASDLQSANTLLAEAKQATEQHHMLQEQTMSQDLSSMAKVRLHGSLRLSPPGSVAGGEYA